MSEKRSFETAQGDGSSAEEVFLWTSFMVPVGGSAKRARLFGKTLPSKCGVKVEEFDGQFSTSKPSRLKLRLTGPGANIAKAVEFLKGHGVKVRRVAK